MALNRYQSSPTTCGNCFNNYYGDSLTSSTSCLPATLAFLASKSCPNTCSNNGKCEFLDIYTHNNISSCHLQSVDCMAKCKCSVNFHGDDCSVTDEQLIKNIDMQNYVLAQLNVIANVDDPSPKLLLSTINSTASLFAASSVGDLTAQSFKFSSNIIDATMQSALNLELPVENIMVFNNLINSCIDKSNRNNDIQSSIQTMYESYVDCLAINSMKQLVSKNQNLTITTSNMQIVITTIQTTNIISSLSPNPPHEVFLIANFGSRRYQLFLIFRSLCLLQELVYMILLIQIQLQIVH